MYHLLMYSRGQSFILNSYRSRTDANHAKAWMKLFEDMIDYMICSFDRELNNFVSLHGLISFKPVQGPYTNEAWAQKCAEIGYKP